MGEYEGNDVHNPKPCFFVEKGVGCKEYKKRPVDPCRTFQCEWIVNKDIPEEFKPDKSDTIAVYQVTRSGIKYLLLIDAGKTMPSDILSWYFTYAMGNQINFAWKVNGFMRYMGHQNFLRDMEKEFPIISVQDITKAP